MVYTVRLAGIGRQGGRNGFEQQLRAWNVVQKNSRPSHPTTCGKAERFQQTMKKWLRAQPDPADHDRRAAGPPRRVHRRVQPPPAAPLAPPPGHPGHALQHPARRPPPAPSATATPTTASATTRSTRPEPSPCASAGRLRHIGVGRTYAGTYVILLIQDLHVRVVNAATGELLRELTIDPRTRLPAHRQTTRTHQKELARTYET